MSEDFRAVSSGYGPRYGPFSVYAPESVGVGYSGNGCACDPTRGQSCSRCDEPTYVEPGWFAPVSIPTATPDHAEEATHRE